MIFMIAMIGLAVCLLAAIKLVDIGFSRIHWNKDGGRSFGLGLLLIAGWVATVLLAMIIYGTAKQISENLQYSSTLGGM